MYNYVTQNTMMILGNLGMLAFIVSVIVQLTKELVKKIPTQLYTMLIAIFISFADYFCNVPSHTIDGIFMTLVSGFMVAYISMYGWETFNDLYLRYKRGWYRD